MLPDTLLVSLFFTTPPPTEIYTLSLHDALPISNRTCRGRPTPRTTRRPEGAPGHSSSIPRLASLRNTPGVRRAVGCCWRDRKSTRLNSSHRTISYAVFCLKKKKKKNQNNRHNNR